MIEPSTVRPAIDPTLKSLLDTFPLTFTAADGVEVARARLRQLQVPPEMLPDLRIEERTIGHGEHTGVPVRIYWPPVTEQADLPIVVFYHGGGWALGDLDTHDPVARAHAVSAQAILVSVDYRLAPEHRSRPGSTTAGPRCSGSASTPGSWAVTRTGSPSPVTRPAATFRR